MRASTSPFEMKLCTLNFGNHRVFKQGHPAPTPYCVILGKLTTFLCIQILTGKVRIMIVPILWGSYDN